MALKKVVKKAAKVKEVKEPRITAKSVVVRLLGMKQVPSDTEIISTVLAEVEESNFKQTHLAWYKNQYRKGRWHEGVEQTIRQAAKPKVEKKGAKKVSKKVKVEATEEVEA